MARTKRSYSPKELEAIILAKLFSRIDGMNENQLRESMPTSQEWRRFSALLDELCDSGRIERRKAEFKKGGLFYYVITDAGRETVIKLRKHKDDPSLRDFIVNLPDEFTTGG